MRIALIILVVFSVLKIDAQEKSSRSEYILEKKMALKGRLLPTPIASTFGIGIEKQIGKSSSIIVLFNAMGYSVGEDAPTNSILALNPEFRYYFGEFSLTSFFTSTFIEIGNHSISLGSEIDAENYTHNKGGNFLGLGLLVGKNMKLGERFYLDCYVGPRFRIQKEEILEKNGNQFTETDQINPNYGVRIGLNLNYALSK